MEKRQEYFVIEYSQIVLLQIFGGKSGGGAVEVLHFLQAGFQFLEAVFGLAERKHVGGWVFKL